MKPLLTNLALLSGAALFSFLLSEIVLRVAAPIPFSMEIRYLSDGHLGTRLVPDQVYSLKDGGFCSVEGNGYRRTEDVRIEKPPGVVRIVALGGSSTFSYSIADEFVWTTVLEQRLREHYGDHVEVINAGVPGYSSFESKINYLYRVRALDPDAVLVYHTWNDMKRFHVLEAGGQIKKGSSDRANLLKSLLRKSQVAWRIKILYHQLIRPRSAEDSIGEGTVSATEIEPGGKAQRWARQNFEDIAGLARRDGVVPILASQASLLAPENLARPEIRARIGVDMQRLSFETLVEQQRAVSTLILEAARSSNGVFVDVYQAVPHDLDHLVDHVHLTKKGNAAVAQALFEGIQASEEVDRLLRR